jgi:hypothetical protein
MPKPSSAHCDNPPSIMELAWSQDRQRTPQSISLDYW